VAIVVLGKKLSEDAFTDEDIRLLKNLANQTAVALDRYRIYEEMLKTQKQLLLADKLSTLGNAAADLALKIKKPLLKLKEMTQVSDWNTGDPAFINNLKKEALKEINELNGQVEGMLGVARGGK
jgi:GAF domain-containing protein